MSPSGPASRRFLLSTLLIVVGCGTARADQVIDTRQGVRTYFYGSRDTNYPYGGDFYGWSMAFGDIDGDGYTDFVSSAENAEGPNDVNEYGHESDVYVFFGRPASEIDSVYAIDTPGVADIIIYRGGFSMACADIDNDGYDDLMLAEAVAQKGVYVIFGAPRDQLGRVYDFDSENSDYTPPDIHIIGGRWLGGRIIDIGETGGDKLAARTLVSGDINGDGYSDIIAGDTAACINPGVGCSSDGAAYIIFGRPREQFPPVIDADYRSSLPHPDVVIHGDAHEWYSYGLAVGDLDGDGMQDLLTSAPLGYGEDSIAGRGEIHGWWGRTDWRPSYDSQTDDFDFALQGRPNNGPYDPGYLASYSVSIGDLDGDGRDDLIMGSHEGNRLTNPPDRINMGEYRIVFGRPRALWPKWGDAVTMTDVLILGAHGGDAFYSASNVFTLCYSTTTGNRNGDPYEDLLIGAGGARHPGDQAFAGASYLIYGRPRGAWEPFIDLRDGYDIIVNGVELGIGGRADLFGFTAGMADIDGDGKDEMFVGAPGADGPDNFSSDCGEISLIYGFETESFPATGVARPPLARATLRPNYPNPFHTATTFPIDVPPGETVSLTIYDALGREVARPLDGRIIASSHLEVSWSGTSARGTALPTGIYFAKLRAGGESHARKVLLVR